MLRPFATARGNSENTRMHCVLLSAWYRGKYRRPATTFEQKCSILLLAAHARVMRFLPLKSSMQTHQRSRDHDQLDMKIPSQRVVTHSFVTTSPVTRRFKCRIETKVF